MLSWMRIRKSSELRTTITVSTVVNVCVANAGDICIGFGGRLGKKLVEFWESLAFFLVFL